MIIKNSIKILIFYLLATNTLFANAPLNIPLQEKIAQMLIVGFSGERVSDELKSYIKKYKVGGIILFSLSKNDDREPNISSSKQLKKLIKHAQKLSKVPLFISIDQEGGRISRLNADNGFAKLQIPSHLQLGKANNTETAYKTVNNMAKDLKHLGFNMNFAPSVDVNINSENPVIGALERTFSANIENVISNASVFIKAEQDAGIIPVIKHFPGHGSSEGDSHEGFTDVTNTYQGVEIEPYKALISSGYNGGIMISHIFNKYMDANYPASLSYKITTSILKKGLGFKGLIISDDLKMGAITEHYSLKETLILAINAGNDILIYGNNIGDYNPNFVKDAIEIITNAVENGDISIERIDEAYNKIMNSKSSLLK